MLDINYIANQSNNIRIFTNPGIWQTWTKPKNCKFIWIVCIGSGAGGTYGSVGGPTTTGFGGGGGGGAGVTRALFSANLLPDTLYVYTGTGGIGGVNGVNFGFGNNGERSWVTIVPGIIPIAAMNTVCCSGTIEAQNGSGGSAGETVVTTTVAGLLSLGNWSALAGPGAQPNGSDQAPFANNITTGGCAGGSATTTVLTQAAGIAATAISAQLPAGTSSTIGNGGNGNNGIFSLKPLYSFSGTGGGPTNFAGATGGIGGNGAYGSGGGGGGGSNGGNPSIGGRGGDGIVIIASF